MVLILRPEGHFLAALTFYLSEPRNPIRMANTTPIIANRTPTKKDSEEDRW